MARASIELDLPKLENNFKLKHCPYLFFKNDTQCPPFLRERERERELILIIIKCWPLIRLIGFKNKHRKQFHYILFCHFSHLKTLYQFGYQTEMKNVKHFNTIVCSML